VFAAGCYSAIGLTCLFQFSFASDFARKTLRKLLKGLHFIDDKIAFFEIPALEIDTEVDGLMVIRGVTFSISTLSFMVHDVELGIKLSDDMELAIQTERVEVKLFRGIWIGDCFANIKGGKYEMTFGELEGKTQDADGDQVFMEGTPLLKAASWSSTELGGPEMGKPRVVKMTEKITDEKKPKDSSATGALENMKTLSPDNEKASERYSEMLKYISESSTIHEAREVSTILQSNTPMISTPPGLRFVHECTRSLPCHIPHAVPFELPPFKTPLHLTSKHSNTASPCFCACY
jgi:hypothetical protein